MFIDRNIFGRQASMINIPTLKAMWPSTLMMIDE
jgi:hypothetical protein